MPANSHSDHAQGRNASAAIEGARCQVAALIGADPDEIIFMPGATLATNVALRSLALPGSVAAMSSIEHPSVSETLADLQSLVSVTVVRVGEDGLVDLESVAGVLDDGAALVAVMAVNNEVGTIQPINDIGRLCEYAGAYFFSDLAQAAGRIRLDTHRSRIAAGVVSSHKLYGPQGVGALYCRRELMPLMKPIATGGGQERGLSPGTLPTALVVGFGAACELADREMTEEANRITSLRDRFHAQLADAIPGLQLNGDPTQRVPGNFNVSFPAVNAEELLALTDSLVASTGSACSSGAIEPSRVLTAMGLPEDRVGGAIRFGLGRFNTTDEIDRASALVIDAYVALTAGKKVGARGQ